MKKILLITTLALSVIFSSCGKKNDTDSDPDTIGSHYNDNLSTVTTLSGGSNGRAGWLVTTSTTTYFSSNNQQLTAKTSSNMSDVVWEFNRTNNINYFQTGAYTDYRRDGKFFNPDNFVIITENGKKYLVVYYSNDNSKTPRIKYEIQELTNTQMVLLTDDVQPLSVYVGNSLVTAHHATAALTFRKL